jgi:hypothetical protein
MSLQALLLITDDRSVLSACPNWMPPLAQPRTKRSTNPFTGSAYEVETLVPDELETTLREPTVEEIEAGMEDEAFTRLSNVKPVAVEFTVSHAFYELIKDSAPFLYGDVHGEVHEIKRIEFEKEAAVLQHFTHLTGPWMKREHRRDNGLSLFTYIYC